MLLSDDALARSLTSHELINNAYSSREIGYQDALNFRVAAVLRPDSLPPGYRSDLPLKSATSILLEARRNRHFLTPENKRSLERGRTDVLYDFYGGGAELKSFVSTAGHFRIHYTIEGSDAVPLTDSDLDNIPDYVEKFADILDHVWDTEIGQLGYNAPPSDGFIGGDCLLDVYLADTRSTFGYGVTQIEDGMPASTVFMIFDNDYSGFPSNDDPENSQAGAMRVTAAHEFFHAIQFQLSEDIVTNGWWMEASATWMEEFVYPDVNDYINYIGPWFENPEAPLTTYNGLLEYGTSVWIIHLTEKYGSKFVYDVWQMISNGESAIAGVEKTLDVYGASLEDELKELRVANAVLTYNDGTRFITWDPSDPIGVWYEQDFTILSTQTNDVSLQPLSARYYSYPIDSCSGSVRIDFDGTGNTRVMVIGFYSVGTGYDVSEILTDGQNNGSIFIRGSGTSIPYRRAAIIPLNYSTDTEASFSLTSSCVSTPGSPGLLEVRPATAAVITGETGIGKQQYFMIQKDAGGNQVLESGGIWTSLSSSLDINANGLAAALTADTSANIRLTLGALTANAVLAISNIETMSSGSDRNCTIGGTAVKLSITSAPQEVIRGKVSSPVMIQAQDVNGNLSLSDINVNLSSTSATMMFDTFPLGAFDGTVTSLMLSHGIGLFYFKDTAAGSTKVTVSADGLTSASQVEVISSTRDRRCFIATAAFGSPLHPGVQILQELRDKHLLTHSPGRMAVSLYYEYSPIIAEVIANSFIMRGIVQLYLIPVIIWSSLIIKTSMIEKGLGMIIVVILMIATILRGSKALHRVNSSDG